jgi:hypothetical protein
MGRLRCLTPTLDRRAARSPAAAFGDGSDAHVLLKSGRISEAVALLPERSQEPRRKDGTSPGKVGEEVAIREALASLLNLGVELDDAAEMARSCGSRVWREGSLTAASEVSGRSEAMASTRRSMTAARRTLWAWKKEPNDVWMNFARDCRAMNPDAG